MPEIESLAIIFSYVKFNINCFFISSSINVNEQMFAYQILSKKIIEIVKETITDQNDKSWLLIGLKIFSIS